MTATNHVTTGALIGALVVNPWLALPLAFASHFVLDSLPHFDYPTPPDDFSSRRFLSFLAADAGMAASVLAFLFIMHPANVYLIMACGVAAASPDLPSLYYLTLAKAGTDRRKWPKPIRFHYGIQKHTSWKFWPIELGWFLVAGSLLLTQLH